MYKKNYKGRVLKRKIAKCEDVCRTYDKIAEVYADELAACADVKSFRCNVFLLMTNNLCDKIPNLLSTEEIYEKALRLLAYDDTVNKTTVERLIALDDIYEIYVPNKMTEEIYGKIYMSLLYSLKKKLSKDAIVQRNENYKGIHCGKSVRGIIGGRDALLISGIPGIGKTSTLRIVKELSTDGLIINENPYMKIIPILNVSCPWDCSVKGLLYSVLMECDKILGTHYTPTYSATTDILIATVSQVAFNIGVLVIDEIQNVVNHKAGRSLVQCLTQLINNSGIGICMVGTTECQSFFEQELYLARRSVGLRYNEVVLDDDFIKLCMLMKKIFDIIEEPRDLLGFIQLYPWLKQ